MVHPSSSPPTQPCSLLAPFSGCSAPAAAARAASWSASCAERSAAEHSTPSGRRCVRLCQAATRPIPRRSSAACCACTDAHGSGGAAEGEEGEEGEGAAQGARGKAVGAEKSQAMTAANSPESRQGDTRRPPARDEDDILKRERGGGREGEDEGEGERRVELREERGRQEKVCVCVTVDRVWL